MHALCHAHLEKLLQFVSMHADIDPFNFFVVEATARCLHLLWERPIGTSGAVTYMVTVENAVDYRREFSTEATSLEVCSLNELTEYTVSMNATSNMTVTDTTVVAHVTTEGVFGMGLFVSCMYSMYRQFYISSNFAKVDLSAVHLMQSYYSSMNCSQASWW